MGSLAETDLWIAISVQAATNFLGCWVAMWFIEKYFPETQSKALSTPQ